MTRPAVRIAFAVLIGCIAGALCTWFALTGPATGRLRPDFDQLWFAGRALLHGRDPYPLVGPGREFDWPFRLNYPPPTLVLLAPLGVPPLAVARFIFVAAGFGALSYAVATEATAFAPILVSAAAYHAAIRAQWSPLLMAALFFPALRVFYFAKPTIAAALWIGRPSRLPLIVGASVTLACLVVVPHWFAEWIDSTRYTPFLAYVMLPGGFMLLALLFRWRDSDARLVGALACVPQTAVAYESLYLGTVPKTRIEALAWSLLTWIAWALTGAVASSGYAAHLRNTATEILWFVYAPTAAFIMFRGVAKRVALPRRTRRLHDARPASAAGDAGLPGRE